MPACTTSSTGRRNYWDDAPDDPAFFAAPRRPPHGPRPRLLDRPRRDHQARGHHRRRGHHRLGGGRDQGRAALHDRGRLPGAAPAPPLRPRASPTVSWRWPGGTGTTTASAPHCRTSARCRPRLSWRSIRADRPPSASPARPQTRSARVRPGCLRASTFTATDRRTGAPGRTDSASASTGSASLRRQPRLGAGVVGQPAGRERRVIEPVSPDRSQKIGKARSPERSTGRPQAAAPSASETPSTTCTGSPAVKPQRPRLVGIAGPRLGPADPARRGLACGQHVLVKPHPRPKRIVGRPLRDKHPRAATGMDRARPSPAPPARDGPYGGSRRTGPTSAASVGSSVTGAIVARARSRRSGQPAMADQSVLLVNGRILSSKIHNSPVGRALRVSYDLYSCLVLMDNPLNLSRCR